MTTARSFRTLTVVVPVYKNRDSLPELCRQIGALDTGTATLDVVFVVDGSPDDSADVLRSCAHEVGGAVGIVELSRNFGSFAAIREGLRRATGDVVAVIAADLQEPPDLVPRLVEALQQSDADVALGTREGRADPLGARLSSATFWMLYRLLVQREMPSGGVDVFAVSRRALDALLMMEERNTSLVGQLLWIGFDRVSVPYTRQPRHSGKSVWTLRKKLRYMTDSVFSFTDLPIRIMIGIGTLGVVGIAVVSLLVLLQWLLGNIDVPGYTPLMLALLFVGFVLVLGLGVIGSYLWRTYENSKGRPSAFVRAVEQLGAPGHDD